MREIDVIEETDTGMIEDMRRKLEKEVEIGIEVHTEKETGVLTGRENIANTEKDTINNLFHFDVLELHLSPLCRIYFLF